MMRAYLSGTPECKFGLNDKVLLEREPKSSLSSGSVSQKRPLPLSGRHTLSLSSTRKRTNAVEIDDCQFHQCVKLGRFDSDRTISFIPPDGEFEMMRYRTTENVNLPFRVHPVVNEIGKTRVEYKVLIKASFSSKLYANNVVVKIPTPLNTANTDIRVGAGKAKYVPAENAIVWKWVQSADRVFGQVLAVGSTAVSAATLIARFQGNTECSLSAEAELSSMTRGLALPFRWTSRSVTPKGEGSDASVAPWQLKTVPSGEACAHAQSLEPVFLPLFFRSMQVLMFTASGLMVRFLKVFEKSNYQSIKFQECCNVNADFLRVFTVASRSPYMTKAGAYQIRVGVVDSAMRGYGPSPGFLDSASSLQDDV
ncbi:MAG: Mu homology domain-containing protein [Olpidium bornovanus]|uniref:Mu homology domain-containing protein n=1 Tax=Olpidium bornovanus TaxID=278681 RepID=A0A8H7ZVD4_9FUNG|nr:MAG: Mu homology domain-containing protein [Olpidium bornovanus]